MRSTTELVMQEVAFGAVATNSLLVTLLEALYMTLLTSSAENDAVLSWVEALTEAFFL